MMKVKFWGVRGSIPCPGYDTAEYGGNTACIELRFGEENRLVIIDAGSGIRALGNYIVENDLSRGPLKIDIFITHTHWDHIIGFPFFTPIYLPGTEINVYGPVTYEDEGLDDIIGGQLQYRYFPIKQSELPANINYHSLKDSKMDLGDGLVVTTKYLNHPVLCLGYRFEYRSKVFCTAYDTEPFLNLFPTDPDDPGYDEDAALEGELVAKEENQKLLQFYKGVDVLVHDSQYTDKEYKDGKMGWGHTSFETAINSAHKARVKKLFLFHHDPLRTDAELKKFLQNYKKRIEGRSNLEIEIAKEGLEIEI